VKLTTVDAEETSHPADPAALPDVAAVGHRFVHGGDLFSAPVVIDERVREELGELIDLAPLHNPPALAAIDEYRSRLDVPHVVVFDTAFHRTIPPFASTYALPARIRAAGVRRFGFQGLSVEWASEQVRVERLVVCHLGGGCSVTAVRDGVSVDTTMGFTPLEGVPMSTRSGSVDPGALLYLLRHGVEVDALEHSLERESGLLGLSGESGDVAELLRADSEGARLALDVFCYRVAQSVAAMTVALGGLDALVFTGGIGEHAAPVREHICRLLEPLGVGSTVRVETVVAREDVVIARAVRAVLD
jgi:acetate kinase